MKHISEIDRKKLEKLFNDGAARVGEKPEHWINGSDESISYCYGCAEKEIERLKKENQQEEYFIDGGWGHAGDSQAFCETCGATLNNDYTQTACEEEVSHFLENGFDIKSDMDCLSMSKVICSAGWGSCDGKDIQFYNDLHKLCRAILEGSEFVAGAEVRVKDKIPVKATQIN